MTANKREQKKIGKWLVDGDVGMSSKSLACVWLGGEPSHLAYPIDGSDFHRCVKFLEDCIDESNRMTLLFEIANRHPKWLVLQTNWFELMELYRFDIKSMTSHKLYERMKELLEHNGVVVEVH